MISRKVLVAPLDWGLGHATRCIPIIREFQKQNCEVQIGGAGQSLELLKREFPELKFHEFPAYAPVYPKAGSMVLKLFWQLPKFLKAIKQEHVCVAAIVKNEGIDFVIADNRYGAYAKEVPCIFVTHQLNILPPKGLGWLGPLLRLYNYNLIKKFSLCWVPDLPTRAITGDLSLPLKKITSEYIGIVSRFSTPVFREKKYDILVLLSGPEPQRSLLEDVLFDQLMNSNLRVLIVRGLIGESTTPYFHANIEVVNALGGEALKYAIESANCILSRSGYSTIMDMMVLQAKCIVVPTPGQTEQLYLAKKLKRKGMAYSCKQHDFQLQEALVKAQKFKKPFPENEEALLSTAINKLLNK